MPTKQGGNNSSGIYKYFFGEFAMSEGQGGGEFYTPNSIVRLLTEVIEPYHGRILEPACGSGGMFVSSARFVSEHKKNPAAELSIHGQSKGRSHLPHLPSEPRVAGLGVRIARSGTFEHDARILS